MAFLTANTADRAVGMEGSALALDLKQPSFDGFGALGRRDTFNSIGMSYAEGICGHKGKLDKIIMSTTLLRSWVHS